MSTGYTLLDRAQVIPQYRFPRRAPVSGVIGLHTAQSILDLIAPDDGAENVDNFIHNRGDYGSYHELHDSDSVRFLAPDNCETWHIAETDAFGFGMNSHSYGISAACRDTDWDPDSPWTRTVIPSMARSAREHHLRNGHDLNVVGRWLSRDDMKRRVPGIGLHGTVQPSDRTDSWVRHPARSELEEMFMAAYFVQPQPPYQPDPGPDPKGDDMLTVAFNGAIYGFHRTGPKTGKWIHEDDGDEVIAQGLQVIGVPGDGTFRIDRMWERYPREGGPYDGTTGPV